jgi:hypothetical protein
MISGGRRTPRKERKDCTGLNAHFEVFRTEAELDLEQRVML